MESIRPRFDSEPVRELNPEQVFRDLQASHASERELRLETDPRWFEKTEEYRQLPKESAEEVRALDEKLVEEGASAEARKMAIELLMRAHTGGYREKRFKVGKDGETSLLKEAFAKMKIVEWAGEILEDEEVSAESLKKVGLISFDADGLKAVNDLSSHENGTEYLRRIADHLHDESHPARKVLEEMGVTEFLMVTGGGDEFAIAVKSDKPLKTKDLQDVAQMYAESVRKEVDVSDLIDFDDEMTMIKYLGVPEQKYHEMDADTRRGLEVRYRADIPVGFRMTASASAGAGTLYDGFHHAAADKRERKRLTGKEDSLAARQKVMGGLFDVSDKAAASAKEEFKHDLRTTDNPHKRAHGKVLVRNSENRAMQENVRAFELMVAEAEAHVKQHKEQVAKVQRLIAQGMGSNSDEVLGEIMAVLSAK